MIVSYNAVQDIHRLYIPAIVYRLLMVRARVGLGLWLRLGFGHSIVRAHGSRLAIRCVRDQLDLVLTNVGNALECLQYRLLLVSRRIGKSLLVSSLLSSSEGAFVGCTVRQ